jgi:predicted Rdx family selenoprotein
MKEHRYQVEKSFVFREEKDGALVFNPDTGEIFAINKTGALIWKICRRKKTLEEIVKIVKKNFEIKNENKLVRDIRAFLNQLKKLRMVNIN